MFVFLQLAFIAQLAVVSDSEMKPQIDSIVKNSGLNTVVFINISEPDHNMTFESFERGLMEGAEKAPVVVSNIGPVSEELCVLMAKFRRNAFVLTAGNQAIELEFPPTSACLLNNILFVGTQKSSSNYGKAVRISIPATNGTEATTLAAVKLALFSEDTLLEGARLVNEFLAQPVP
ncbi:MAG: hypothetical protein WCK42_02655 [Myxococcaceae bacterium]